tara:strand:- start:72949 stop:73437 length:489 start_codon:yes stop_codon:yes gene_type:complete
MANYLGQNNIQAGISLGVASLLAGYCYSFGWSALSGLGLVVTSGAGVYVLFKLAELCVSLKTLVDSCNDTVNQVNMHLLSEVEQTVKKANDLADKLDGALGTVSTDMLPEAHKTLLNVQAMTEEANKAVERASGKVDEMLSGQMVLQLGTASSQAHIHALKH